MNHKVIIEENKTMSAESRINHIQSCIDRDDLIARDKDSFIEQATKDLIKDGKAFFFVAKDEDGEIVLSDVVSDSVDCELSGLITELHMNQDNPLKRHQSVNKLIKWSNKKAAESIEIEAANIYGE